MSTGCGVSSSLSVLPQMLDRPRAAKCVLAVMPWGFSVPLSPFPSSEVPASPTQITLGTRTPIPERPSGVASRVCLVADQDAAERVAGLWVESLEDGTEVVGVIHRGARASPNPSDRRPSACNPKAA